MCLIKGTRPDDLGGAYLDMGIESTHKINVLDPDPNDPDGCPARKWPFIGAIESFKGWFVTALGRALIPEEEEVLDKAYFAAFEKVGIHKGVRETLTHTPPLLSDLQAMAKTDINGASALRLASVLALMAEGGQAAAFNVHTNVNVRSNPLVVFGLSTVHRSMMSKRIRQIQQFTRGQITGLDRTISDRPPHRTANILVPSNVWAALNGVSFRADV